MMPLNSFGSKMKTTMKLGIITLTLFMISLTTNALAAPPMSLIGQIKTELEVVQNTILDALIGISNQLTGIDQEIDGLDPVLESVIANQLSTNSDLTTVLNEVNSIQNEIGSMLKMEQIQGESFALSTGSSYGKSVATYDYNGQVRHVSLTIKSEQMNGVTPFFGSGDVVTVKIELPSSGGLAVSMPIFKITSGNWRYEPFHIEFDTVAWSISVKHGGGSYNIVTRFYGTATFAE